jgi:hypothetical protein
MENEEIKEGKNLEKKGNPPVKEAENQVEESKE